ncbi:hypothetical protein COV20_01300 [Candidatus Woesearchaeota archaeon CG10_big_fil_rev_8_21_14_0_10_45_16]|nr:MAG: hypothetical protein COV20_01300 [Candidatus Woesearchaeota archaeon CG10_big_fil_rev_8_21_14_0_10_45_16]
MKNHLLQFIDLCKKEFGRKLISVILFGSRAKGQYHDLSDFDFYIVVKEENEQKKWNLLKQFPFSCDIIMRKEENIGYYLKNLSAIDLEVINTGRSIYGKDIIAKYKPLLRDITKEHHLVNREHLGKGVWEIGFAG